MLLFEALRDNPARHSRGLVWIFDLVETTEDVQVVETRYLCCVRVRLDSKKVQVVGIEAVSEHLADLIEHRCGVVFFGDHVRELQ